MIQTKPPRTAAMISSTIPVENLAITGVIQGDSAKTFREQIRQMCSIAIKVENRQIISCCLATNLIWYVIRRQIISRFRFKYRFRNQLFFF